MSNELLRVRRVWERHDFALPCTEGATAEQDDEVQQREGSVVPEVAEAAAPRPRKRAKVAPEARSEVGDTASSVSFASLSNSCHHEQVSAGARRQGLGTKPIKHMKPLKIDFGNDFGRLWEGKWG